MKDETRANSRADSSFISHLSSLPKITLDRRHSFSGRDNIDWFFKNRKWIRAAKLELVECSWAVRSLPEGEASIRFLLLAPKRNYKRAHDRNKIKRWLRAAISKAEDFDAIEETLAAQSKQLLVTMKISKPIAVVRWNAILEDVRQIAEHLKKRAG